MSPVCCCFSGVALVGAQDTLRGLVVANGRGITARVKMDSGLRRNDDVKRSSAKYRHSGAGRNPCLTWQSVFLVALRCANGYSKRHRRPPAGSLLLPKHALDGWIFVHRELQLLLTGSVQQAQLIADNFSGVTFDTILARPLARLQMAFDVDQRAFSEMLPSEFGESFIQYDPMPFGGFPPGATGFVFPGFTGRN